MFRRKVKKDFSYYIHKIYNADKKIKNPDQVLSTLIVEEKIPFPFLRKLKKENKSISVLLIIQHLNERKFSHNILPLRNFLSAFFSYYDQYHGYIDHEIHNVLKTQNLYLNFIHHKLKILSASANKDELYENLIMLTKLKCLKDLPSFVFNIVKEDFNISFLLQIKPLLNPSQKKEIIAKAKSFLPSPVDKNYFNSPKTYLDIMYLLLTYFSCENTISIVEVFLTQMLNSNIYPFKNIDEYITLLGLAIIYVKDSALRNSAFNLLFFYFESYYHTSHAVDFIVPHLSVDERQRIANKIKNDYEQTHNLELVTTLHHCLDQDFKIKILNEIINSCESHKKKILQLTTLMPWANAQFASVIFPYLLKCLTDDNACYLLYTLRHYWTPSQLLKIWDVFKDLNFNITQRYNAVLVAYINEKSSNLVEADKAFTQLKRYINFQPMSYSLFYDFKDGLPYGIRIDMIDKLINRFKHLGLVQTNIIFSFDFETQKKIKAFEKLELNNVTRCFKIIASLTTSAEREVIAKFLFDILFSTQIHDDGREAALKSLSYYLGSLSSRVKEILLKTILNENDFYEPSLFVKLYNEHHDNQVHDILSRVSVQTGDYQINLPSEIATHILQM